MSVAAPARAGAVASFASTPRESADPGFEVVEVAETRLREIEALADAADAARATLAVAEEVLVRWVAARGEAPTSDTREGFRLLALHRQGAQDLPSFNACRETCREIAFHYNLLRESNASAPSDRKDGTPGVGEDPARTRAMMGLLVHHLALFVGGKMHSEGVGEFCCASRPLREHD